MITVSVSELKARLSHYLRRVARGEEIQIVDRGVPIARLIKIPFRSDDVEARSRLVAEGTLRSGKGNASRFLDIAPLELPVSIVEAIDEDRADRL
jgi:prevent-host-death family protein